MLMKKKLFNLRLRSRWLLVSLLTLLAGVSPVGAQVTESFEYGSDGTTAITISDDAMKLSNGWTVVGSGSNAGIATSGWSKTLKLQTNGARSGNCIYAGSNTAVYIVCPVEVSGTLSFYWKRNDSGGTVKIYAAEKDGETYTIGNLLATADKTTATNMSSYFEFSTDLGAEPIYVAFLLNYAYLDDVTYTKYVDDGSLKKPKALTVSDVTASSAVLSWTAGGTETAWDVSYSTTSGNPDNGTIVSASEATYTLTGLTAETTYYAAVRAKDGADVSNWTSEVSFTPTKAKALTVNDGTSTNSYVPIYGMYVDAYDKVEFIIPAADLANMANSDIKALKFYLSSPASASWGNANFKIYMTEVENTTISSYTFNDDNYTALYNGSIDGTQSEMDITLTTPYSYNGGNLLVGVYNTVKGTYKSSSFYGVSAESGVSAYGTSSSSLASVTTVNKQSFLPKTTFTYLPIDGPVMKVSETAFDFGTITAESSEAEKTKTFTISNKGNATLENIAVSYTGDNVFSLSDGIATSIVEGGNDITVTVTMNASVAGTYNGTITIKADGQNDATISLTGVYAAAPATMALTLGEDAVGETVAFGNVGKSITKTFTVTNDGNLKLNISSITSSNAAFTVSPSTLEVAGKSSETFTVTFVYDAQNLGMEKTANITVTPSNEGLSPVTFAVSATSIEMWSEDFSGSSLPNGWEITNSKYWKLQDNMLKGSYSYGNFDLITPSLIVEEGQSMTFDYRMTSTYRSLDIQYSKNNGAWTNLATISYSGLTQNQWYTYTIEGLEAGNYKFRFGDSNYDLDNFEGFKLNNDDPKFGIYTDAGCTTAAAASVTKDFGFVTTTAEAQVYYLKNDNTGTLTLTLGEVPTGFTAALGKASLAAGESTTLTIGMSVETKGYKNGNIIVTAKNSSDTELGTFTVAASGVAVDENKLYLDFATADIPASWTVGNYWTKSANGYVEHPNYSNTTIETASLNAIAGEDLVIEAKQISTGSSYTLGVNYKKSSDSDWTTLISATNIGSDWTLLHATIEETGEYQLQFVGSRAQIRRIYGLTEPNEPFMAVYDGTTAAAASYSFGNVANDADATHTFTIKNEGNGTLAGVTATLSGDQASHYAVEINGLTNGNIAGKSEATLIVKQLKDNIGAHAATLTISSTSDGIDDIVIALSGTTRDASKMHVDFADGIPATWTTTGSWTTSSGYAQAPWSGNATLTSPALTIAAGENLTVDLSKQYNNNSAKLTFRYTTDGGINWTEQDLSSDLTYGEFTTKTLSLGNTETVTAFIQFVGTYYARIDNIYGGVATTAPLFALATEETLSGGKYDFGQSLQEAPADKTFTITNNGNDNLVSTIAVTGDVTATLATTAGELSNDNKTVTLEPGETATLTVSLTFNASQTGTKSGNVTISSNAPVANVSLDFTANVIDATFLNIDFADNSKPTGFYSNGWTYTSGYAANSNTTEAEFITSLLTVAGAEDALTYQARAAWDNYSEALTVSYSTDRKNWTEVATLGESDLTTTFQTFRVSGLEAGNYYLRFTGARVYVDNISGWHFATPIAEHDLYISATTFPTTTLIPATENGVEASATVYSLRANETGVTAKLFFGETEIATAAATDIAKDGSTTFTMTGNVPAEEGTYAAKIRVYYSDNSVAWETATTDVEVAHTRTLDITDFTRTDGTESLDADANNQFSAAFNVTVTNTGSTAATPTVKIFIGETEVGTATAAEAVAAGGETTIAVSVTNASAGEGGQLAFTAKAYWTANDAEAKATSTENVTITVNAVAPRFALYQDATPVNNGDDVMFGLQKGAKTFSYTIKNEGTAPMELISIVAPEGFEATVVTDNNKTIAVNGTLDIDVTLQAEQGKKAGNLVITYKVDATTNLTFTLALSGHSVSEDTWVETFDTEIPADWTNNGWEWNRDRKAAYSTYTAGKTLITPRLAANAGDVLTFDVIFPYSGYKLKAQWSTDYENWTEIATYTATSDNQTIEAEFTAPADGNYYIMVGDANSRYVYVDNFVGFKLNPLADLTLFDTEDLTAESGRYAQVTVKRSFNKGWGTVVLPFDVDENTFAAKFGNDAKYYTLTKFDNGELTFARLLDGGLKAGTPYLINLPEAIDAEGVTFDDVVLTKEQNDKEVSGAWLRGNYDAGMSMAGKYGVSPAGKLQKGGANSTMKAYRAYIELPAGTDGARVAIDETGTTGISHIVIDNGQEEADGRIYNLQGQRVQKPQQKGFYIKDGKKVFMK